MGGLCFFGGERGPTCDTIHGIYPIFSTFISINICRFLYVFLFKIELKGNLIFICAETGSSKYICKQTRLSCFGEGSCIVQYFYIKPIKDF